MTGRALRILFLPREAFPTNRVRINALFGRELLGRGHRIDLVMQAADDSIPVGATALGSGTVFVGKTDSRDGILHRLHKHWLGLLHDLGALRSHQLGRYEAILISDKFLVAAIALLVSRHRKLKFLFWLTFPYPEADLLRARERTARYPGLIRLRGSLTAWLLYKWIIPRSDHVFVQSERMKCGICAHHIDAAKVSPVFTGFDLGSIQIALRPDGAADRPLILAYLGTLSAYRHLEILIEMLALLRARGTNAKLLLVGDAGRSEDRLLLERRAQELQLAAEVEITGFIPHAKALERVAGADIGLSPIYRSPIFDVGSPTKLVEYMALGLPVVGNNQPEQELILRESRAGVCVPWGARHFTRAVRWLLARGPGERARMGKRGREWVEANRTYARIADDFERTCATVLAGSNPNQTRQVRDD